MPDAVFTKLQIMQLAHDEGYHRDILALSVQERCKHMALHFSKYTGGFASAILDKDEGLYGRILTDSMVIALSTANTIGSELSSSIPYNGPSLLELGAQALNAFSAPKEEAAYRHWFLLHYAQYSGRIAKACEGLDHLEDFAFKRTINTNVSSLATHVCLDAARKSIDLTEEIKRRHAFIAGRTLYAALSGKT